MSLSLKESEEKIPILREGYFEIERIAGGKEDLVPHHLHEFTGRDGIVDVILFGEAVRLDHIRQAKGLRSLRAHKSCAGMIFLCATVGFAP